MPAPTAFDPIDLVDSANRPAGVIARGAARSRGVNFRTVHVLLFDDDDRVLLQRLAAPRDRHPGRLGSSVAGYLHAGEGFAEASQRRTIEELGIDPDLESLGVLAMLDGRSTKFVGVFRGSGRGARVQDPSHVAELIWMGPDEVDRQVAADPDQFTPTFRTVWCHYRTEAG